jgi:hypothetical protein
MSIPTLTLRELNRATLARQMLLAREPLSPLEAVGRLVALQAQWPKPPFIGLWSRLTGFQREDLITAVHGRSLLRATLMRATIHLMDAANYGQWRPLLQPMLTKTLTARGERGRGVDPAVLMPLARQFLAKGPATFEAIRQHLAGHFPDLDERIMGYAVRMTLPLVQVPTDATWGYPQTADWALADEWTGQPLPEARDADVGPVLQYLAAFGPASVADMQNWTGLKGLKPLFERARPQLRIFQDDQGRELFDLPDAPRPPAETPAPVRFLPEFDNVVIGHDDRRRFVPAAHRPHLILPGLRVPATFLVDGMVAGTWTLDRQKRQATLALTPFERLPKPAVTALTQEGEALVRFQEPAAETVAVTVGPGAG